MNKPPAWIVISMVVLSVCCDVVAQDSPTDGGDYFEKQIRPLLVKHCFECHGDQKPKGGLRLHSRESLLHGGDTGPAVVPGKPDDSLIIRAVGYLDELKMPPKQKLAEGEIAKLRSWVTMGVPWPVSSSPSAADGGVTGGSRLTPRQQTWWSYQPVKHSAPPIIANTDWPRCEIDCFIEAERQIHGMSPAPVADRRTWLRRATFDLTGLPPTPEELDVFIADTSEDACERVVDRLLASFTYGQTWARHWLDVVRYADYHDADGKVRDANCEPLQAWRYRNWVVDSLNRDLPFDQFIVHQIAGDLLPSPEGHEFYADGLIATTFLSNGTWDRGDADKEKMVSDMVDDNIDTIGKAFLGLTLGCARCHDHKFDPVSQQDYYALAGVFYSTRILKELGSKGGNYTLHRVPLVDRAYVTRRDEQLRQIKELETKFAELDKQSPKPPPDDPERLVLVTQRDTLKGELLPEPPLAEAVAEGGTPGGLFPGIQDVPVHIRGSYTRLGPTVPRRMPSFFAGQSQATITAGSGRREVAQWVASKDNPLTARVIVNRIWQGHFGEGLVRTPNNFGLTSQPPSHPALLDWLAARFVEDGWSLKKLHRQIMLSATYRQSSVVPREQVEQDPENRLLGRFTARRLTAEAIRDAVLFVSGRLDSSPIGPAQPDLAAAHRSLYVQTARWDRGNFSTLFDAANPDASVDSRTISTVAPQALFLLNNRFLLDHAGFLAGCLIKAVPNDAPDSLLKKVSGTLEAPKTSERFEVPESSRHLFQQAANAETLRIHFAYRLLFGRLPNDDELAIARQIVQPRESSSAEAGWVDLAHVLLCSNEFVYID